MGSDTSELFLISLKLRNDTRDYFWELGDLIVTPSAQTWYLWSFLCISTYLFAAECTDGCTKSVPISPCFEEHVAQNKMLTYVSMERIGLVPAVPCVLQHRASSAD